MCPVADLHRRSSYCYSRLHFLSVFTGREKRGEPHGWPRKALELYNYNLKKVCARACSDVNAYMAAASHSQRTGFPRPQTQTSICGGGYLRGFACQLPNAVLLAPVMTSGLLPCVVSRRPLHLHRANALNALFTALMCINRSKNDYRCTQGGNGPLSQATACSHSLLAPRELS